MVDLENHHNRSCDHGNRNGILERNENFTEHHLRLSAESSAHHIDRLGRRNHNLSLIHISKKVMSKG